ncbi:MAG: hypothetical protein KF906_10965 [Actinobacteria bacterium]|nr:hypothetical protein [Actinomycetota bacterium]
MRHLDASAVLTDPVLPTLVLRRHRIWLVVLANGALLASVSGTVARALDDLPGLGPIAFWPAAAAMYAPTVGAVFDPFADWRERTAARAAWPTAALLLVVVVALPAWLALAAPVGTVAQLAATWALAWAAVGCVAATTRIHAVTWLAPASLLVASVFGGPPEVLQDPGWWTGPMATVLGTVGLAAGAGLTTSVDRRWGRYGHGRT